MSQTAAPNKQTSAEAATAASKTLTDGLTNKASKSAHVEYVAVLTTVRCYDCKSTDMIRRGAFDLKVHAPPIGLRKTVFFIKTPRVECRHDRPISTGPLERTNNKIKTPKRQACGFHDLEYFGLKIPASHLAEFAIVG